MSEEMIAIIISLISLIICLKEYLINKPKLKIVISDKKCDAYFGTVCVKNENVVNTKIGAVEINIINNSPVDIFIKDIRLKIGKDYHRLVSKDNSYWDDSYFFYYDKRGEKMYDGCGINYELSGISMPNKVNSYTILSGICLFHDFPNIDSKSKHGKIILSTAVGKITKKVKFIRYDENYRSSEMRDVDLYMKNSIN